MKRQYYVLLTVLLTSFGVAANEFIYEPYDCAFSNQEIKNALEKPVVEYFASINVSLKEGTFQVNDSSVDPRIMYSPADGMIVKKVEFEASSGEWIALQSFGRNGDLHFLNMGSTRDGLLFEQAKRTEIGQLGNVIQTVCILAVKSKGLFMVFKNLDTDQKLIELTKDFNKYMGNKLNALGTKTVH